MMMMPPGMMMPGMTTSSSGGMTTMGSGGVTTMGSGSVTTVSTGKNGFYLRNTIFDTLVVSTFTCIFLSCFFYSFNCLDSFNSFNSKYSNNCVNCNHSNNRYNCSLLNSLQRSRYYLFDISTWLITSTLLIFNYPNIQHTAYSKRFEQACWRNAVQISTNLSYLLLIILCKTMRK